MLPAHLQTLRDAAANVQREASDIATDEAERLWRQLLAVAIHDLAPVWQYVTNMNTRPHGFPWEGPPDGGQVFEARISVPGCREIIALFTRPSWLPADSPCCHWSRSHYRSGRTLDVEGGRANWMVSPPSRPGYVSTYYQTLGAALLAAER